MEKYSGSNNRKLVIQNVCKEDEGEYCAFLSGDLNGSEYENIRRNSICLHIVGGTIGDKQHTKVDEGRLTHIY